MKCKRIIALTLSVVLVVGATIGGTMAWLVDRTNTVENTFTYGDINITLDETKLKDGQPVDEDGDGKNDKTTEGNEYRVSPGVSYLKDPVVTVKAGSEKAYVFVKIEKEGGATVTNPDGTTTTYNFDNYLEYQVIEGLRNWTAIDDGDNNAMTQLYYTVVDASNTTEDQTIQVLLNNEIKVKDAVSKEMLNALDNSGSNVAGATYPTMKLTAYAVQFSAANDAAKTEAENALTAWSLVK